MLTFAPAFDKSKQEFIDKAGRKREVKGKRKWAEMPRDEGKKF
jgi:hypothetical protein